MLASVLIAIPEIVELIPEGWELMKPVLVSAVVGAIASGLSAMYNGVVAPILERLKSKPNGGESSVYECE